MRRVDLASDGRPYGDTVPTGFPSVDRALGGGVRRGDLVVLGGDVGSGKSSLALAMALRMAETGGSVAFLTGEMTAERVMERALALEGRVRVDDLRSGNLDEMTRASVGAAAVRLRENPPQVEALPRASLDAVRSRIRELGCQVVIVDSLAALALGEGPQDELLASAVRALKATALDLDLAVIVTAQIPKWDRSRSDPRPTLDDFGALGAVKQLADVVLAIYREEMYVPGYGVEGATELLVRKNRNGTTGYIDLYFYKQWMRFEDMLDPDR